MESAVQDAYYLYNFNISGDMDMNNKTIKIQCLVLTN